MTPIHLAVASTTSMPAEVTANLLQIVGFARRAAADGVDVLLTPELSASGYGGYPDVMATAEPAGDGPIYHTLASAARECSLVVCAGFVERDAHNSAVSYLSHYAVYPDGRFVAQRKNKTMPCEKPMQSAHPAEYNGEPGEAWPYVIETFEIKGVRCALSICADAGLPDIDNQLEAAGVQVLLAPSGAGGKRDERVTTSELRTPAGRERYLKVLETVFFSYGGVAGCLQHKRALCAVNLCGYDGRQHHHVGHGMIMNAMGEVPALFHGQPNLDRQRPMYAHALVDVDEHL
jgi:predicted amidohydrolase